MTETTGHSFITDSRDLQYISDIVSRVLEEDRELSAFKYVQPALKELSLERGREIQMNLVVERDRIVGFNFSFQNDPGKTTPTIPFRQQLDLGQAGGEIVPHRPPTVTLEVAAREGDLARSPFKGDLVTTPPPPPLQAEGWRELTQDEVESIHSAAPGLGQMNSDLARMASLASRSELDGLWLTGMGLKAGTTLARSLSSEEKPDLQSAGNAVVRRFYQVLPQEFEHLKAGGEPKPFNWKDPQSGRQYRFQFEPATFSGEGRSLTPATLTGFEQSGDDAQPVFSAHLVDARRDRWTIEQCDFNSVQLRSLSVADRSSRCGREARTFPERVALAVDPVEH